MRPANQQDNVEEHQSCTNPFNIDMENTRDLLMVLGSYIRDVSLGTQSRQLFENLLSHFIELTGSEFGLIGERLLREEEKPYLKTHAITNIAWDQASRDAYNDHAYDGMEFNITGSLIGHVLAGGNPLISNHPATDPRACGTPAGHPPLHAFLGIPLYIGDQYLGMVGIANRAGGYDSEVLRYLEPLSNTTAALIHTTRMEQAANRDPLTSLANRRQFNDRLDLETSRCKRHGNALALLMIDIDHFKNINDSFGHEAGDYCLIGIGKTLSGRVRREDLIARLGGEEFAIVLPDTKLRQAVILAEELRTTIAGKKFILEDGTCLPSITVSIGVAAMAGPDEQAADFLVGHADKLLYKAKKLGRNKVCYIDTKA